MTINIENCSTLVDILQTRYEYQGNEIAYRFLKDGEIEIDAITYQELDHKAKIIASHLQSINLSNQRVIIIYPYDRGLDFITAFFGCLYGRIVAVTCHPPLNRHGILEIQERLNDSQAQGLIAHPTLIKQLKEKLITPDNFNWIVNNDISTVVNDWQKPTITPESLAFLQYTSGSTGKPKGVMITHQCILDNQKMLKLAFGNNNNSIGLGWLPLFHDMGLIGLVIQALYVGRPSIFMSPVAFIQKPVRWLQAISRYKATTSGAPNFAYDLLCRHVTPQQRENLDLSHWELAFCGGEPIQMQTVNQFCQLFSSCGFRREAFYPCYGMAEATLLITGGKRGTFPIFKYVNEMALENNLVVTNSHKKAGFLPIISVGKTWLDAQIKIVNPHTLQPCFSDELGEVWISGSGLGKGYWQDAKRTKETFQANIKNTQETSFLRTGDLGFLEGEELFITGRLNDVMVFWGLNYYPQLIEQTVAECNPALKQNCTAAVSVKQGGEPQLIIVSEIDRSYRKSLDFDEIVAQICWSVFDKYMIDVYSIVLLKTGKIPKTSSGKIQRYACKIKFINSDFEAIYQWRCQPNKLRDITSVFQRYFNPLTHLKRYFFILRGKMKRLLS